MRKRNCLNTRNECIPFVYHIGYDKQRHQHYKATFFVSAFVGLIVTTTLFMKASGSIPSLGFKHLSHFGHQALAAIGLIGCTALIGFIAGLVHQVFFNKMENPPKVSVNSKDDGETELTTKGLINESTNLVLGKDKNDSLIYRIGKYNPLRLAVPPTPLKTGVWISMFGLLVFAVANLVKHDLFNQFAGVSPVMDSSSIFVKCYSTTTNNMGCVLLLGYVLGCVTSIFSVSAGIGGLATLFHYAGAKASESPCLKQSNNEYFSTTI